MTQVPDSDTSIHSENTLHSDDDVTCWVRSVSDLEALVDRCLGQPFVAIDTEFERTSTYFANPGLIQIADTSNVYLVDPLAVTDLVALGKLLEDESVVKVLHSMSEDIELLHHACGVVPVNVFDTQVAATFLDLGVSMGYQRLVLDVLGVELDKSETRSDWLQRPLSPSQIHYAVKDTAFLRELYSRLRAQLEEKSLLEACFDECRYQVNQVMDTWAHPELAYLKLRGAWSLSPERQMLLQDLVIWRDQCAVEHNVPKSWVFSDALLIEAVEKKPGNPKELYRFKGIKGRSVKQFGARLIQQLEQFEIAVDGEHEFKRIDAPLRGRELELYKQLKKVVTKVAETSGLPAQLLASRKNLEQVVVTLFRQRSGELPAIFHGWRKAYLEAPLKTAYEAYLAG